MKEPCFSAKLADDSAEIRCSATPGVSSEKIRNGVGCAYAGLAPTTHSSGGKTYHGDMLPFANRWLKWAFIEASWVAIGCSSYFGEIYQRHRARGKQANTAITIIARRMCRIAWQRLREKRDFSPNPPEKMTLSPVAPSKD